MLESVGCKIPSRVARIRKQDGLDSRRGRKPRPRERTLLKKIRAALVRRLREWKRRARSPELVRRASILLALRETATYQEAARAAGTSVTTVRKWRSRYLEAYDAVQRGELGSVLQALQLQDDPERRQQINQARRLLTRGWTTRRIAGKTGLTQSTVARLRRKVLSQG